MLLTPTYHVFKMYTVHMDAQLLETEVENAEYAYNNEKIPQINVSSSIDSEGKIHISICNLNPNQEAEIDCELDGFSGKKVTGKMVSAEQVNSKNTFENPEEISITSFQNATIKEGHLIATLPAKSVVVLEVE